MKNSSFICKITGWVALGLSLLLLAQIGLAAPPTLTWSPPYDLSQAGGSGNAQIALSADGARATAIWVYFDGTNYTIQSASATITGNMATWGSVTNVSLQGPNAINPKIAVSSDGSKATAIWFGVNGGTYSILSASATIDGNLADWSGVTQVSIAGQASYNPNIAMSSDGSRVIAIWYHDNRDSTFIQSASATVGGKVAAWGAVTNLSISDWLGVTHPQVSISANGSKATAIWTHINGSVYSIQSASATLSGSVTVWGNPSALPTTGNWLDYPEIALSGDGARANAVWERYDGNKTLIQSASANISDNTATWGNESNLSEVGQNAYNPVNSISTNGGMVTAAWYRYDGSHYIVQSASATVDDNLSTWGGVASLSTPGLDASPPRMSLSGDGTKALAVWYLRYDDTNWVIQSAVASVNGSVANWGSATNLTNSGQISFSPQIAIATDGTKATSVWTRYGGTIQSSSSTLGDSNPPPVPFISAITPLPGGLRVAFDNSPQTASARGVAVTATAISYTASCVSSNGGVSGNATGSSSPIDVMNLTAGRSYTCTVSATDAGGTSISAPSAVAVPLASPTPSNPIPSLSEWAKALMMLALLAIAGWRWRGVTG